MGVQGKGRAAADQAGPRSTRTPAGRPRLKAANMRVTHSSNQERGASQQPAPNAASIADSRLIEQGVLTMPVLGRRQQLRMLALVRHRVHDELVRLRIANDGSCSTSGLVSPRPDTAQLPACAAIGPWTDLLALQAVSC